MNATNIRTVEDLGECLRESGIALEDIAPAVGLSHQGLSARLRSGQVDGLFVLAILKAAINVAERRVNLLRDAVRDYDLEAD